MICSLDNRLGRCASLLCSAVLHSMRVCINTGLMAAITTLSDSLNPTIPPGTTASSALENQCFDQIIKEQQQQLQLLFQDRAIADLARDVLRLHLECVKIWPGERGPV